MNTAMLLLMILASVVYIALPYFRKKKLALVSSSAKNGRLADLYAHRDNLLAAIKDLEFDQQMGKISVEDFSEMNTRYRQEAVMALKRIEALNRRNGPAQRLEAELRALRSQRKENNAAFCSACGAAVGAQDRFCSHCGKRLHQ